MAKRGRKAKVDWELYKDQLQQLRSEGKSLTELCEVVYEKLGVSITAARVSQVLASWKQEQQVVIREEIERDAEQIDIGGGI